MTNGQVNDAYTVGFNSTNDLQKVELKAITPETNGRISKTSSNGTNDAKV